MKHISKAIALVFALLFVSAAFMGCAAQPAAQSGEETAAPAAAEPNVETKAPFKFAVVFATGGLGDKSFNDSVYEGCKRAAQEFGAEFQYVEPTEIAEFEGHHREFAKSGEYDLIFGIGYDQQDAVTKVAAEYPNQKFVEIDGLAEGPNVASCYFNDNEKAFLMGILVGKMTKTNKVGMVGGMDIPLIAKFYAGFKSGVKYVNPAADVSVKYVGGWADVNTGKEIALSMYDSGCDILYAVAGGSGLGVHAAALERDKLSCGSNGDQIHLDPDHIMASTMRRLDELVYAFVKEAMEGSFQGGQQYFGVAGGFMDAVTAGSNIAIPQEVLDMKEAAKKAIESGEIVVPSTPEEVAPFLTALSR